jgi:tRNA dimethylallyltransferase
MTLEEASARAILNTGQYTKRQATWFRHHALAAPTDAHMIHARVAGVEKDSKSLWQEIFNFVDARR